MEIVRYTLAMRSHGVQASPVGRSLVPERPGSSASSARLSELLWLPGRLLPVLRHAALTAPRGSLASNPPVRQTIRHRPLAHADHDMPGSSPGGAREMYISLDAIRALFDPSSSSGARYAYWRCRVACLRPAQRFTSWLSIPNRSRTRPTVWSTISSMLVGRA